ncbi:MAG: serine/threonine-protein phosphatase [Gammaproteobacteria bacterium]|nr:serine/threonine-protein phosphatase [Gammaproteobacteria bacterium]MCP5201176.1 serine/threonine-protein phosphatase [Gammaproteobacteria bacterium]
MSDVGKVRKLNEDSGLDRGDEGLWVVADGMGGHSAGDLASQLIVNSLGKLELEDDLATLVEHVEDAVVHVNGRLFEVANAHNQTSGSTVVVLLMRGRYAVTMWAGDSRLYRWRDGELTQLTTDHTQIELYIEKGLLDRAEAEGHPSGNMVTRAVGVTDTLTMEMDIHELADGDRFLLCSDGLDKHVKDPEIERILATGTPAEVARELVDLTLERGAIDNVTVCIVEVTATCA